VANIETKQLLRKSATFHVPMKPKTTRFFRIPFVLDLFSSKPFQQYPFNTSSFSHSSSPFPLPHFYHSINQLLDILKKLPKKAFILRCRREKKYQNIYDEIKFNLILRTPSKLSEHARNPHILSRDGISREECC
jgi:hypothetical protein